MKKLITLLLLVLAPLTSASAYYQGTWKHHLLQAENLSIRLSYKESRVTPTYGLNQGGRIAREIYLDVWGDTGFKTIDYRLKNFRQSSLINELTGTLIKENHGHQYDKLPITQNYIWLQGNQKYTQKLTIWIDGRKHEYEFCL
ncbi:MAG: hypothetical protein CME70_11955 [Halobacteriovorax sp.]|nr:hypothetical protein [Halobacteriovorax sp.]